MVCCSRLTLDYPAQGVSVTNFSRSFNDGLAFCALLDVFYPQKIRYSQLDPKGQEANFALAFRVAEEAGVYPLLDVEDMVAMERPDPLSVMTYVSQLYRKFGSR